MAKKRIRSFDDALASPRRTKFDVLGTKKRRTEKKRSGVAHEVREKTLLVEYRKRGKNNQFVDRRFVGGEENGMGGSESIERFQKERMKQIRKDPRYKLVRERGKTETEEEAVLTHGGKPLDELDDEEIQREAILRAFADEDDAFGALTARETALLNFGGGREETEGAGKRKTKSEVMAEIIAKSKMYKALKAKQREDDLSLLKSLDEGFRELVKQGKSMGRDGTGEPPATVQHEAGKLDNSMDDEAAYDRSARELVFDMRAKAGERTKTSEELEAEEQELAERLEKQRKQRMEKEELNDYDDEDIDEGEGNQGTLALDFDHEADLEEESTGISSEDGIGTSGEDSEYSEGDVRQPKTGTSDSVEEGDQNKDEQLSMHRSTRALHEPTMPETYDMFSELADGMGPNDLGAWVKMLRKKAPKTAEERKAMQILYGYLMQYFSQLGAGRPIQSKKLDALVGPIFEMTAQLPLYAQTVAHGRIMKMLDVHNTTISIPTAKGWPDAKTFLQIKLWCVLFPGSDFAHPVLSPLSLLIGSYLNYCPVVEVQDALKGMLLCGLALKLVFQAKRYFPEAINFLTGILDGSKWSNEELIKRMETVHASNPKRASEYTSTVRSVYEFLSDGVDPNSVEEGIAYLDLINMALDMLREFCTLLIDDWGAAELLEEIRDSVAAKSLVHEGSALESKRALLACDLSRWSNRILTERARTPVASGPAVPVQKTFNPRYEEDYVRGRDYDVDKERAALRRLRRTYASEAKGAARELKKDNYFLAEQRRREVQEASATLREEQQRNFSFLEQLEANMRSGGQSGSTKSRKKKRVA